MSRRNGRSKQTQIVIPNTGSSSILTRMFRQMLFAIGVASPNLDDSDRNSIVLNYKWDTLMNEFLEDSRNSIPQNIKDRSSARGNLNKEILTNKNISWKVFCKALRFLGVIKFDLILNVTIENHPHELVFKDTINFGKRVPYPKVLPTSEGISIRNYTNRPVFDVGSIIATPKEPNSGSEQFSSDDRTINN